MHKFNSGNGATVCDWCSAMLVDGRRVVKAHREINDFGIKLAYCGWRCMMTHGSEDKGMHRSRVVMLAEEVARLRLLEVLRLDGEELERAQGQMVSCEVKPG